MWFHCGVTWASDSKPVMQWHYVSQTDERGASFIRISSLRTANQGHETQRTEFWGIWQPSSLQPGTSTGQPGSARYLYVSPSSEYLLYQTHALSLDLFTEWITNLLRMGSVDAGSFEEAIQNELDSYATRHPDVTRHRRMAMRLSVRFKCRSDRVLRGIFDMSRGGYQQVEAHIPFSRPPTRPQTCAARLQGPARPP